MVVHGTIADELHLGDAGDGLEVGVEDGLLGLAGLVVAVAVALGGGVEGLGEGVLLLGGELDVAEEQRGVLWAEAAAAATTTSASVMRKTTVIVRARGGDDDVPCREAPRSP